MQQFRSVAIPATISVKRTVLAARGQRVSKRGQVAQVVERSPEKAGVGGSTPSLATIILKDLGVFAHFLQPDAGARGSGDAGRYMGARSCFREIGCAGPPRDS